MGAFAHVRWVVGSILYGGPIELFLTPASPQELRGGSVRSWCDVSSDRSFKMGPMRYFSFQPVLHEWHNDDRDMCYSVCGMMHIKEPLLLIGNSVQRHITENKMCCVRH